MSITPINNNNQKPQENSFLQEFAQNLVDRRYGLRHASYCIFKKLGKEEGNKNEHNSQALVNIGINFFVKPGAKANPLMLSPIQVESAMNYAMKKRNYILINKILYIDLIKNALLSAFKLALWSDTDNRTTIEKVISDQDFKSVFSYYAPTLFDLEMHIKDPSVPFYVIKLLIEVYDKLGIAIPETATGRSWSLKTIRELSSKYELDVLRFFGEKYLHFVDEGKREKCLILVTTSDSELAFDIVKNCESRAQLQKTLEELSKHYDVKIHSVNTIAQIEEQIHLGSLTGRVTALFIKVHGEDKKMMIGDNEVLCHQSLLENKNIFGKMDPNGVIVLDSCSTGKDPQNGIGAEIAEVSKRVTFAASKDIYSAKATLISTNPLVYSFKGASLSNPDEDVTVKFVPKDKQ